MLELIVGPRGSGKTGRLVDELNTLVAQGKSVVCIESGKRLDSNLTYKVRLVDISNYPVKTLPQLLSFIAGICSKDYDLEYLYIDSIHRISEKICKECLLSFLQELELFAQNRNLNVVMTMSAEPAELDACFDKYLRK